MTTTLAWRTPVTGPSSVAAVLGVALVTLLGWWSLGTWSAGDVSPAPVAVSESSPLNTAPGLGIVLRVGARPVAVSLTDTAASRRLAAMLPAALELDDSWGQAKTGRLPQPLPAEDAARVLKPMVGGVYYWPGTQTLAVYYDDLGQSVPPPGLVALGAVVTGLDAVADAGLVTVHLESPA